MEIMNKIEDMKLSEMREAYPDIKANSKASFIAKVNGLVTPEIKLDTETINMVNRVKEHFPAYLIKALAAEQGCECEYENYEWFLYVNFEWTAEVDAAIIKATFDAFGERVKVTSCAGCLVQRRNRLRNYYRKLIDG